MAVDQQAPAPEGAAPAAEAPARALLVIDTRLADYQKLAQQAAAGAEVILVDAAQDGLAAVSERLAAGAPVASIQILSHGGPGQFVLGSRTLTADSLTGAADTLRAWAQRLTADADILLYGCNATSSSSCSCPTPASSRRSRRSTSSSPAS